MNYYERELNKLVNSEYGIQIVLADSSGNKTKTLQLLTDESINSLKLYLDLLQIANKQKPIREVIV